MQTIFFSLSRSTPLHPLGMAEGSAVHFNLGKITERWGGPRSYNYRFLKAPPARPAGLDLVNLYIISPKPSFLNVLVGKATVY